jgi:uncharacterized protein (TIGR02600 family)
MMFLFSRPSQRLGGSAGFSLILVLVVLVLISILILSFFAGVTGDLSSTTAYANESGTRALSENVVQLLESQITDATTAPIDTQGNLYTYKNNKLFSWASQPGMIRTYDQKGQGLMFYKLYSSDSMRTVWNDAGTYANAMSHDLSAGDMADPAQFTDLNSPVTVTVGGNAKSIYPIADPDSLPGQSNPVQGFSVNADAKATTAPTDVAGVNYAPGTSLPMPVRWLYKLEDGTLVAAPSGSNGTVDLSGLGATTKNPIVGRVAFWADDETSKVNINTAGEGTYWDTPRFWGTRQSTLTPATALTTNPYPAPDYAYAISQPVQYEFQRYPGHPAQVALSPIFPNLTGTPAAMTQKMATITPFLANGGSQGGLIADVPLPPATFPGIDLTKAARKTPYASVDEFLYNTSLVGAGGSRTTTDASIFTASTLQAAKFFVTADSRAPELNLFGMPRIACWPISKDLQDNPTSLFTSIYDRLIAFCSSLKTAGTTASQPYYFQREWPNDPTHDYNQIPRNIQLYQYLQNLTGGVGGGGTDIPGFGKSLLAKYSTDRDQILTEIFDYIRCTDIADPNLLYGAKSSPYTYAVSVVGTKNANSNLTYPITPIQIGATMGFGRTPIIDQVGIGLICMIDGGNTTYNSTNIPDYNAILTAANATPPLKSTEKIVQAAIFLESYNPSDGPPDFTPNISLSITGAGSIAFANAVPTTPFVETSTGQPFYCAFGALPPTVNTSPCFGPIDYCMNQDTDPAGTYAYSTGQHAGGFIYRLVSRPFKIDTTKPLIVSSGTLTITMLLGKVAGGRLQDEAPSYVPSPTAYYQKINFQVPSGMQLPAPILDCTIGTIPSHWSFQSRITPGGATNFPMNSLVPQQGGGKATKLWGLNDVVKSFFLVDHGDSRLLAASSSPKVSPTSILVGTKHDNYVDPAQPFSNFFRFQDTCMETTNTTPTPDLSTSLIPNLPPHFSIYKSNYPVELSALQNITLEHVPLEPWSGDPPTVAQNCYKNGDFDNMIGVDPDGPGINKPDEGDTGGGGGNPPAAPYLSSNQSSSNIVTLFTPNRIIPSPGMFGSLPTGVIKNTPWQTLLFRPQPGGITGKNYFSHTQAAFPNYKDAGYNQYTTSPDHLFMDLFWMPIVEPYAISDSFSTAGKINMNYQIEPFTYIDRSTPLVCLMKNENLIAVPDAASPTYKSNAKNDPNPATNSIFRFPLDTSETGGSLRQFRTRFDSGDIFRSSSEICDIFLAPSNPAQNPLNTTFNPPWASDNDAANFWGVHRLTGDNSRERPYTNLYGRLTTKSNTFTIHMRVQSLKQSPASRASGVWVESRDVVTGEYRGSTLIERYIDPNQTVTDYASVAEAPGKEGNLDNNYKFRVVRSSQFAP